MEVYAVGGSVRDLAMGVEPRDFDYVVVGSCHDELIHLGFKQVGRGFPVYSIDGDEYALARTDTLVDGVRVVSFSPEVSLMDDLMRRDLTINAMALSPDGGIIDYFGGLEDIDKKILRHVSDSFDNDPIRVLRVARFMARLSDFSIAEETMQEMKRIVCDGGLLNEPRERIWKEVSRALLEPSPELFFKTLKDCGALDVIMPEISRLSGVPQSVEHHPEVDTFVHVMMTLKKASELTRNPLIIFSALVHDLGKGVTDKNLHPRHFGHEELGCNEVMSLCDRIGAPKDYSVFGLVSSRYHTHVHMINELRHVTIVDVFDKINAYRKPLLVEMLAIVSEADARGRLGFENYVYNNGDKLKECFEKCKSVSLSNFLIKGRENDIEKIKAKVRVSRASLIRSVLRPNKGFEVSYE